MIFALPGSPPSRMTLPGLRSRCTTPARVRVRQRVRELQQDAQRIGDCQRAVPADRRLQIRPGDVLHAEVQLAVGELAGIEDLDDARVAQLAEREHLAAKPRDGLRIGCDRRARP